MERLTNKFISVYFIFFIFINILVAIRRTFNSIVYYLYYLHIYIWIHTFKTTILIYIGHSHYNVPISIFFVIKLKNIIFTRYFKWI